MGIVKLKLGNLFDEPTDLIILPCSTKGAVADFVATHLSQYSIPLPQANMQLGDVDIQPFNGAENIAQFVAFAASVPFIKRHLNEEVIEKIGEILGKVTCEMDAVRLVSSPLLGSGEGGLFPEDVVEALSRGFKKTATKDSVLTIFVLEKNIIGHIKSELGLGELPEKILVNNQIKMVPIRVFISYSGTSSLHLEWIKKLATYLRSNGLDARLDQWHLRAGMDMPQWMANELQLAERIIIITDSRYAERADGRVGGVGWETMLIQGDMMFRTIDDYRYIVIVRDDNLSSSLPRYLKTKYSIHWTSNSDESALRMELLKELYNIEKAPPIGVPPLFV